MTATTPHRLDGFEPDNLLAFLALLGLLRALEAVDADQPDAEPWLPRAGWQTDRAPLRPYVQLRQAVTAEELAARAAQGIDLLAADHDFGGRLKLDYTRGAARTFLSAEAEKATRATRGRADLLAALMSDGATEESKEPNDAAVDPTPLCLMFGQGNQCFLERLSKVPAIATLSRGSGKKAVTIDAPPLLAEALFAPWHYDDNTPAFRWDPAEAVRYALLAGDPSRPDYKAGTQHGANRLAVMGIAALTLAPEQRGGRARPAILGGRGSEKGFSFAWPIWPAPISLSALRALLAHPDLHAEAKAGLSPALRALGIKMVYTNRRLSLGKYLAFSRAG